MSSIAALLIRTEELLLACQDASEQRRSPRSTRDYIDAVELIDGQIRIRWNTPQCSCGACPLEYEYDYFSSAHLDHAIAYQRLHLERSLAAALLCTAEG